MLRQEMKRAEEFLKILFWANKEIKKANEKSQLEESLDILEQCQEAAVNLGTLIEEFEGEGFITVKYIEEFCEQVYEIHEEIIQKGTADADAVFRAIDSSLINIEKSIQTDISICKIALFLPYNASMWDALESVWRAADADSNCKAYVMPIPYYEKNADGSFGTMHYEGNEYPSYVPITDYRTFDFAANRPDMIFIHNPYDERNLVTSVHPFFYSSKLKDLTDMLVYIPYYAPVDRDLDDKDDIQYIKQYCYLPGISNADYVFLPSEKLREAYIRAFTEQTGEKLRPVWEKKIQGLGSPKYDGLIGIDRNDIDMPDNWKRIILKENGEWKKIILYNTALTALLKQKDKMLDKIEDVIRFFQKRADSVVLLWRPHPLFEETIKSMRPQLWERYCKIAEDFQKTGEGIFDETADLRRAVVMCDIYYGDSSSVVGLCKYAGKWILMQNVNDDSDLSELNSILNEKVGEE